jgi:hypothetical protein
MTHETDNYNGLEFSLDLGATTTAVAAGNIVGAAAAAATQFALFNPVGSGRVLVLSKFAMGVISGTPGAGPLFHGYFPGAAMPTLAANGTIVSSRLNGPGSVALAYALAAGTALTGGPVGPKVLRAAAFSSTATAQASPGMIMSVEDIEGDIIVPAGYGWIPLWSAAGAALLNAYSITWKERVGL